MFLVLANSQMWLFPRKTDSDRESGSLAAAVRLPVGAGYAGPIAVTGSVEDHCLGAYVLTQGGVPALFGVSEPAPVTVKWRRPGGKVQTREVFVEEGPVRVDVMTE